MSAELLEECVIHLKDLFAPKAELLRFEQFHQSFAINQFDWNDTLTVSLFLRVRREPSSSQQYALVGSAHDRITEIAYLRTAHTFKDTFALKEDLHCYKRI